MASPLPLGRYFVGGASVPTLPLADGVDVVRGTLLRRVLQCRHVTNKVEGLLLSLVIQPIYESR
jgi:hypothetical protein